MEDEHAERQLNIHLDPENLAGVYANFANVSFSDYEFTLTFARIDHEVEEGDVPGVVVSRVNMSPRFMRELMDAMNDSWSKWSTQEGIRNLPEQGNDRLLAIAMRCMGVGCVPYQNVTHPGGSESASDVFTKLCSSATPLAGSWVACRASQSASAS